MKSRLYVGENGTICPFVLKFRRVTIRGAQPSARLSEEICPSKGSAGSLRGLCGGSLWGVHGIVRGFSGVVTLCLWPSGTVGFWRFFLQFCHNTIFTSTLDKYPFRMQCLVRVGRVIVGSKRTKVNSGSKTPPKPQMRAKPKENTRRPTLASSKRLASNWAKYCLL